MESLPDGSVVLAVAGKMKYMSQCGRFEQMFYAQQIDTVSCVHSYLVSTHIQLGCIIEPVV